MGIVSLLKRIFGGKKEETPVIEKVESMKKDVELNEKTGELTVKDIKSKVKKSSEKTEVKRSTRNPNTNKPVREKLRASKSAIKLAKENGIDLSKVKGSGKEGSIIKSDVEKLLK
jgi:pyruvate dehydrogenase E2 component (dihydrolipoamide acetyltransferase)